MNNSSLIDEGRYLAKPVEWGITKTKAGKPNVFIAFNVEAESKTITWFGSLNEGKAREITIKSLVNCGFAFDSLSALDRSDALDTSKSVSLTIEHEEREKNGAMITVAKVAWVNKLGNLKADKEDVTEMLSGLNLKGELMMEVMGQGMTPKKASAIVTPAETFDSNDIPF